MILYSNAQGVVREIKEKRFLLEREIQKLFEQNIQTLMGVDFVKSEFIIKNRRIDTLAFDSQSNSFVIIEFKRDKNFSVFDQGVTYLGLMLENKADFIIEYNEVLKRSLKRDDVDWSQSKVVFVSSSFTEYQVKATNFKDLAIELWEVKQFENDTVLIKQIKKTSSAESIKPLVEQSETIKSVTSEIEVFTEQDHIEMATDTIKELYERFRSHVLNLSDDIEVVAKKKYIAFKQRKNIVDVIIQKKALKIFINLRKGDLDDPKGLAMDVSEVGHWGNGDYQLQVNNDEHLEYIMSLIKQSVRGR